MKKIVKTIKKKAIIAPAVDKETTVPPLIQILRREFLGDMETLVISDEDVLKQINDASKWGEFKTEYEKLDNPSFKSFIQLKLEGFGETLSELRTNASESKAVTVSMAKYSSAASAGCLMVCAAAVKAGGSAATAVAAAVGANASLAGTATASAAAAGTGAAYLVIADLALLGGTVTAGLAIGSMFFRKYYAKEEAAIHKKINLLKSRTSELRKKVF